MGTTTVTLTVCDEEPACDSCTAEVTVTDESSPVITARETLTLWPPNHEYHRVRVEDALVSATDDCDASVDLSSVVVASVHSDEPENARGDGDGNTQNDIVIECSNTVLLRSERQGKGNTEIVMHALKDWHERFGAELVCHFGTMLQFAVAKPPQSFDDAWSVALEHELYADAGLYPAGVGIRDHARALMRLDKWFVHQRP